MSKRTFSLPPILMVSLLIFALVPAGLVAWLMARSSAQAVQDLAGGILINVAAKIQVGTQAHVGQAHNVLNGLFSERLNAAQTEQARDWLRPNAAFESMAFALSRQSPDVPKLYFGNSRGEYFSVESTSSGVMVQLRGPMDTGLQAFMARRPGDRSQPLLVAQANLEPRTWGWYQGALIAKRRVFSPIQAVPGKPQLFVTLSQPVYDSDEGAAGAFGVDLYLQRLADLLQTQSISAHGAAFIVDEAGLLVAGSAGDALFQRVQGRQTRRSPQHSANPVIRASFAALQLEQSRKREDSVAGNTVLQRLPMPGDNLMMVRRRFGESLGLRWTLVVAAPESDFTADISRAWKVSLTVMGGLVLLGALAALYMANRIGRGLKRLSVAAQQLGCGEVPRMERGTRLREVLELSQVMHDSAAQLQSYRAEVQAKTRAIEEANEMLEERLAQRTVELLASREEAWQAAQAKAAFLATMRHEIRTPLNGVVGMSTLLAETRLDKEQSDYLQTIRLSSDQLLAVINDILDFSKIESGKLDLEAEPLSPRSAIKEACDVVAPRAREKNLGLIVDVPEVAGMPPSHDAAPLFEARLLKPARQKQLCDTLARRLSVDGRQQAPMAAATAPGTAAAKNVTLLVVDDNAVNLKVACAMLAKLGYHAQTALDGREAVQAVACAHGAGWRFGAVLMDVNMPRMNGFQATQQIQAMMGKKAPPIIALTAAASPEDRVRCIAAGMDDYLTKPLHVAALAQALERCLPMMTATREGAGPPAQPASVRDQPASPAASLAAGPEPHGKPEPRLMDLERLAQFKEFDDDALSMTREVIGLFVADASLRLKAIEDSIRANDASALAWAAHALVGATGNVGAVAMQTVCGELEREAKTGLVPGNAARQLERLQAYWVKTCAMLDTWV